MWPKGERKIKGCKMFSAELICEKKRNCVRCNKQAKAANIYHFRTANILNVDATTLVNNSIEMTQAYFSEILNYEKIEWAQVIEFFRCARIKGANNKGTRMLMVYR